MSLRSVTRAVLLFVGWISAGVVGGFILALLIGGLVISLSPHSPHTPGDGVWFLLFLFLFVPIGAAWGFGWAAQSLNKTNLEAEIKQPTPTAIVKDVERIVRRDFPQEPFDTVMDTLNEYGTEKRHHELTRVQLAVLKIADGKMKDLQSLIEAAKRDYRDVLAGAEYPGYAKLSFSEKARLPIEERQRIIDSDWKQYETWLKGKPK